MNSVSTAMLALREEKPMSRENIEQRSLAWTGPFSTASIFDDSGCPCATNGSQVPGSNHLYDWASRQGLWPKMGGMSVVTQTCGHVVQTQSG